MSEEAPLVIGGVLRGKRYTGKRPLPSHATFITTSAPVVEKNAIIIGVVNANFELSDPVKHDGWFLSDFYAFNYLLKGLGSEQVWISAVDPRKLVEAPSPRGRYLHGNPYGTRKVVLSKELLDKGEITLPVVVPRSQMIEKFLDGVREKSEKAAKQNAPLLLLIFCHSLKRVLNLGMSQKRGLKPSELNEAIHPQCRVTMLTTACFSGGWLVSVPGGIYLNVTAMTAADHKSLSSSWIQSPSIGRHSGSPWASTVIDTLLSTSGPFLAQPDTEEDSTSLQPDNPTEQQMETYNSFCRTVLTTCMKRITRSSNKETFTFSAQDDNWNWPWGQRTGIPFDQQHLRARWDALETYAPQVLEHDPSDPFPEWHHLNPDPRNPIFSNDPGLSKTGGTSLPDKHALAEVREEAVSMAEAFLETCPNDWDAGYGPNARGVLTDFIEGKNPTTADPIAMMRFRWETIQAADNLVAFFCLPVPDEQYCLMWDRFQSLETLESEIPNFEENYDSAFNFITDGPMLPQPIEGIQGPVFYRFAEYIATAVAMEELSSEEQDKLLIKMRNFVLKERKDWAEPIVQVAGKKRSIVERGLEFISQTKKRVVLRSLSPRKRASTWSSARRGRSESHAGSTNLQESPESTPTPSPAPLRHSMDSLR